MSHDVAEQFADCGVCPRTGVPIRICYNVFEGAAGPAADAPVPTILLIMGIACPAPFWDDKFCYALASKGRCRVIRFDSRDVGLSTHLNLEERRAGASLSSSGRQSQPAPSVLRSGSDELSTAGILKLIYAALQPGRHVMPEVYSIKEMALDVLRLLAALGVRDGVHLVGMSLGGVVAQEVALQQPRLVASLTLLATRSANPRQGRWPSLKDMVGFLALVPRGSVSARFAPRIAAATTRTERDRLVREREAERARLYGTAFAKFVGRIAGDTHKFPFDEKRCAYQMQRVFSRSAYMGGCQRQFLALRNAESRDEAIQQTISCTSPASGGRVFIPTMVIHGTRDVLCPVENGRYLHRLFANSTYHEVAGMGHTLPPAMRNQLVSWIWANVSCGEAAKKASPSAKTTGDGNPPPAVESKL